MTRTGTPKRGVPIFGTLASIHDLITRFTFGIAIVAAAYLTLSLAWEVVARYALASPTGWIPDTASISFALVTFMGAPMLAWKHGHVSMDIVVKRLPERASAWVQRFALLVSAAACLLCAWFGYVELLRLVKRNVMMIAVTPIPKWWLMAAIVYCLLSMGIYFLRHFFVTFRPAGESAALGEAV